jgi:hypothetical protein
MFFGDRIVGLVKHTHTPGHRMCSGALSKLTNVDLELLPIPRHDVLDMVQRGSAVSTLDLTIAAGSIDAAAEADDVVAAAEQLRERVPGSDKVTVSFSAETAAQQRRLRSRTLRLLQRRGVDGLDGAHARIFTDEAGSELVNLLEADISTNARIEIEARTRHLLPAEAHDAALQAFALLQVPLTRSIALAVDDDGA